MYPKVSVIIPLYNQKRFIAETIESVLNQTYPRVEIVVVNDGSTDDPLPVIRKYGKKIHLINQKNCGLAGARNTGLRASDGKYIQFLDGDDLLKKNKISQQMEYSLKQGADISYCEIDWLYQASGTIVPQHIGEIDDIFPYYYNFWLPYPTPIHSLLFRRNVFDRFGFFDQELKANEDRFLLSMLAAKGQNFKYAPFGGGLYRIHDRSMNANRMLMISSAIDYFKKINRELGDEFFARKFGYSPYQMMCANLTFLYFQEIQKGTERALLNQIKRVMKQGSLRFFADPIPSRFKTVKFPKMIFASFLRRWLEFLKNRG